MAGTITLDQWRDQLAALVRTGALKGALLTAGASLAMDGARTAGLNVMTGGRSGLTHRSGSLLRSMAGTAKTTASGVDVVLQSGGSGSFGSVPYARIHEEGGTIRPKRAKMLAIPIHPQLKTAAGIGRVPGPRDVPDLTFVRSLKGAFLLVNKHTGEPWFLLKRQVTIKARPFLQPALETTAGKAERVISEQIARVLS